MTAWRQISFFFFKLRNDMPSIFIKFENICNLVKIFLKFLLNLKQIVINFMCPCDKFLPFLVFL